MSLHTVHCLCKSTAKRCAVLDDGITAQAWEHLAREKARGPDGCLRAHSFMWGEQRARGDTQARTRLSRRAGLPCEVPAGKHHRTRHSCCRGRFAVEWDSWDHSSWPSRP